MAEHTTKKREQPGTSSLFVWWLALIALLMCSFLMISQIQTVISLQQQGIVAQSIIVATSPCSLINRQPNSSASQQGFLLMLRFTDSHGKQDTITFPDCQQGTYHIGDTFPIRYLPNDPTILVRVAAGPPLPDPPTTTIVLLSIGILLSGVIVIVGVLKWLDERRLSRTFAEQRRLHNQKRMK